MGRRFNPAPGWPPPPPGFVPPRYWQPDPSWPPAPPGWQLWVDDSAPEPGSIPARPDEFGTGAGNGSPWADDFRTGAAGAASWADLSEPPSGPLTGPPTQAYVPGATGPQDPFGPGDPFTRQRPLDPLGEPDDLDRPGHRARAGKTDGFAIASLLLGVFGITVIGAILSINLGIMALRRVRRTGQPGRGLAIAGLVLSTISLLIVTFFVLGAGKGPSQPSASGGPSSASGGHSSPSGARGSPSGGDSSSPTAKPSSSASPGSPSTNVFALQPGQCFQNPSASQTELGFTYVTVVACTKPHNAQAFAQVTVKGTSWPGTDAVKRQADSLCHAQIKANVQISKITSSMSLRYLYPLESSWAGGHRTITCLIVNSTPDLKTSVLRAHSTGR